MKTILLIIISAKAVSLVTTLASLLRNHRLAWRCFLGRYRFDRRQPHGVLQLLARFIWESPQLWVGYNYSQLRILLNQVTRVDYYGGSVFLTTEGWRQGLYMGISFGCCINVWTSKQLQGDFDEYVVKTDPYDLYKHEYGHTFDSLLFGPFYLPIVGVVSALGCVLSKNQQHLWTERSANRHARKYFGRVKSEDRDYR